MKTYDVPRVAQIGELLHDEAHGDDFEHHFDAEDDEEDDVEHLDDGVRLGQARVLHGQTDTVAENGQQNHAIEPGVEHDLHDEAAEAISRGAAAQRLVRKHLRLALLDKARQVALSDDCLGQLLVMPSHL